jgi:hypothetical protein
MTFERRPSSSVSRPWASETTRSRNAFYDQTVGAVRPELVVPSHRSNFFPPLTDYLEQSPLVIDDVPAGFDFMTRRLGSDGIQFKILQGYASITLFGSE